MQRYRKFREGTLFFEAEYARVSRYDERIRDPRPITGDATRYD